ncbi:MAG: hypothetical protein OS130_10120 [Thermodesulfobacteriota bacterium]|nr:MAG: hypothetical protein OS130_10120 [Thermodesulfobacteriota bacterium]
MLDINKNTVSSYRLTYTVPNIAFVLKFCDKFGFNYEWFIFGKGEPFPGARAEFPEVCGPEQRQPVELKATITGDQTANYTMPGVDQFGQAVSQLKTIFDNRDPTFIQAIMANLNTFGRAIEENQELRNKINSLEKRIAELEAGVQREGGDVRGDTSVEGTGRSTEKKAG